MKLGTEWLRVAMAFVSPGGLGLAEDFCPHVIKLAVNEHPWTLDIGGHISTKDRSVTVSASVCAPMCSKTCLASGWKAVRPIDPGSTLPLADGDGRKA
jgi:hypothetical protein